MQNETDGLAALHSLRILDTEPTTEFDAIADTAASIFEAPFPMVSFMEKDALWFKTKFGLAQTLVGRDVPFCSHTIMSDEILEIEDTWCDERLFGNLLLRKTHRYP